MVVFREERLLLLLLCLGVAVAVGTGNMNPQNYSIANPTGKTPSSMSFYGEYFEVLGPESTSKYGEVTWHSQPVDLPKGIVSRFDGKVMAVTGMEVDIVRTVEGANGEPKEVSAVSYELYNHHYSGWMYGKHASPSKQTGSDDNPFASDGSGNGGKGKPMAHGMPLPVWEVEKDGDTDFPDIQAFSEGNGNEHRGSYKGYAKGFAQLIKSPTVWANNPMIINTNKKLVPHDTSPGHISRLVPKHSLAPADSTYSGILECPCTDRKIKILDGYQTEGKACPGTAVTTAKECFHAAANNRLRPLFNATAVAQLPSGCSVTFDETRRGWVVGFNPSPSKAECSEGQPSKSLVGAIQTTFPTGDVQVTASLAVHGAVTTIELSGPSTNWFAVAFNATIMADTPYAIVIDGHGAAEERRLGNHAPGNKLEEQMLTVVTNTVAGSTRTIVLTRATEGKDSDHYSFQNVAGRKLPVLLAHGASPTLSYHGPTRTSLRMTLIRSGSASCVCRDPNSNSGTIDGITFNPKVCAPSPMGELLTTHNAICNISEYEGGLYCCHDGSILLDRDQEVPKKTDTWRLKYRFYFEEYQNNSHRNLFRTWWSTEATNNVSKARNPQPFTTFCSNCALLYCPQEYDVPKSSSNCLDPKTPKAECVHEIRSKFQGKDVIAGSHGGGGSQCMVSGDDAACGNVTLIRERDGGKFQLMYAAAHCHTPACESMELWNDDTNELICRNAPRYGNGTAAQDELSYVVAIPPCVWGSKEEGLRPPPILSLDSNLTTIKRANSTNGHWGVMALWQMRAAYIGGNPWERD
jgi:hypothetical protein|eukprot:g4816.t1